MIWNQLMIDIECAGTERDAALMSIGAAFFDLHSYKIGPTFILPVHLATSVRLGMKMYPETIIWWLRQGDDARNAVCFNMVDIRVALERFSTWCAENSRRQDLRTWGNAASFDLGILGYAYHLADMPAPWTFGKETCFRTVRNMNTHVEYDPATRQSVHHNALDDSLFQIEHLFKIRRFNLEHRPLVMPK